MEKSVATRIWVVVSAIYGVTLGVVAALNVGNVSTVAIIGAAIVGIGWLVISMMKPAESETSSSD